VTVHDVHAVLGDDVCNLTGHVTRAAKIENTCSRGQYRNHVGEQRMRRASDQDTMTALCQLATETVYRLRRARTLALVRKL
jgi:hypothetical protein